MSCDKANNCKKYKMNIGNPNDWENPCNHCPYNISDYEIGYNKAIDDFLREIKIDVIATTFGLRICDAERIAQQLKTGGENEI